MTVIEAEAVIIREVYARCLEGASPGEIARELNDRGGSPSAGSGGRGDRVAVRDATGLPVQLMNDPPARWVLVGGRVHLLAGDRPSGVLVACCGSPLPLGVLQHERLPGRHLCQECFHGVLASSTCWGTSAERCVAPLPVTEW